jgi:hypothetical protein
MENTLYYTFSTIAQALGGAIGLMGAFVLYRLQSIDQELFNAVDQILVAFQEDPYLQEVTASGDLKAAVLGIEERLKQPLKVGWGLHQQSCLRRAHHLLHSREALSKAVRPALWFPGLVMCGAVVVLSMVTVLAPRHFAAIALLAVGVLAFSSSIWLFVRLVLRIIESR